MISDSDTGTCWELRYLPNQDSEEGDSFIVESSVFPDRSSAELACKKMEAAILVVSLNRGFGVALNERQPSTVITEYGLNTLFPPGIRAIQDKLGTTIFETPPATVFVAAGSMKLSVGTPAKQLVAPFEAAIRADVEIDDRTRTAYELFTSSRFENSSRARFLLLIMAIEAMIERVDRPLDERIFLDGAINSLKASEVPADSKQTLANGLRGLKKQSISTAARATIAQKISAEAALDFRAMYDLRSRLVHGGKSLDPSEVCDASNKLEPTVKTMLLKRLSAHPESD